MRSKFKEGVLWVVQNVEIGGVKWSRAVKTFKMVGAANAKE